MAEHFIDASVHKTIEVDLALITSDDAWRKDLARFLLKTAKRHDPPTRSLRHTVPGMGKMFSRVLLDAIHHIERVPRVQEFASSCRWVPWRKASGGKRLGTSGKNIGKAHLTWAFSEAAALF